MRLFDAAVAAPRSERGSRRNENALAVLPDDILHAVMDRYDWHTWRTMAQAAASCARYASDRIQLDVGGRVFVMVSMRPVVFMDERR
jgi:hypothetical protein